MKQTLIFLFCWYKPRDSSHAVDLLARLSGKTNREQRETDKYVIICFFCFSIRFVFGCYLSYGLSFNDLKGPRVSAYVCACIVYIMFV